MPRKALPLVLVLFLAWPVAAAPVPLARDGKALLPIVISRDASDDTRAVAADLAGCLSRITGAAFAVEAGDGTRGGIILGTLAQFPDEALARPLEIRDGFDGREAYAIRTEPGRVRLIGATELGASHAAYRFLEHLGCRWFFPAREWEVVPKVADLSADLNLDDRPAILARRIWYGYGHFRDERHRTTYDDYKAWARRNRMASSFVVRAGHAYEAIVAANRKEFDQHPEYFALVEGRRRGPQLCASNPRVRAIVAEYAVNHFRPGRAPEPDMVSVEPADGSGHCSCDECRKIGDGSVSDQVFDLANHAARAVAAAYPGKGKMVGILAYSEHCEPPSFRLEPNVYVQLTAGFTTGRYTFAELCELWPKVTRRVGYYEYLSVWLWDRDLIPGGRGADVGYLARQIGRYAELGATSIDAESGNNWGPHGRGYFLANRLMWDPKADAEAILADFYDKAFGPAAPAMRRYYERLDPGSHPLAGMDLLARAFRDVEEATRLASGRPDVLARLAHLKQYLRYNHLVYLRDREPDPARKKDLALAVLRHVYRARASYMNHWEAMRQEETPKLARRFNEPSWDALAGGSARPWRDETPVMAEETERDFAEGLAFFRPEDHAQVTFSAELVPVNLAPAGRPAPLVHAWQGPATYAVAVAPGQALDVTITTGTIAWYRNRADARYAVTDAAGREVASGRLKLDGQPHAIAPKLPPGVYRLDVDDSQAGWKITVPAGRPAALLLRRDQRPPSHMGHMPGAQFFYVPKGTTRLRYFWSGGPHRLLGPDGRVLREVKTTGELVAIDVPPGADGKPWRLDRLAPGRLHFFNAPNVLAASPDAMLLPRDLAERDGLAPAR